MGGTTCQPPARWLQGQRPSSTFPNLLSSKPPCSPGLESLCAPRLTVRRLLSLCLAHCPYNVFTVWIPSSNCEHSMCPQGRPIPTDMALGMLSGQPRCLLTRCSAPGIRSNTGWPHRSAGQGSHPTPHGLRVRSDHGTWEAERLSSLSSAAPGAGVRSQWKGLQWGSLRRGHGAEQGKQSMLGTAQCHWTAHFNMVPSVM